REWLSVAEDGLDRRHDLAVHDTGHGAAQLVAGAEAHLRPGGGRVGWRIDGLVEEPADGTSTLATPQVDEVAAAVMRRDEPVDQRIEPLLLRDQQRLVVEPGAIAQCQLHQQLRPHISEVLDRGTQPAGGRPAARRRRCDQDAIAALTGAAAATGDETLV